MSGRYPEHRLEQIPGPGSHEVASTIGHGPAATIKGRYAERTQADQPGPGAYDFHEESRGGITMAGKAHERPPDQVTTKATPDETAAEPACPFARRFVGSRCRVESLPVFLFFCLFVYLFCLFCFAF